MAIAATRGWFPETVGTVASIDGESGHAHWQVSDEWYLMDLVASPNGQRIAVAENRRRSVDFVDHWETRVRVLSADGGAQICRLTQEVPSALWNMDAWMVFSPDSRSVAVNWRFQRATGAPPDQDVQSKVLVFDAQTGQPRCELVGHTDVHGLSYSPDSRHVAAASTDGAVVFDAMTGAELPRSSFTGEVFEVAFSPDGQRVAAGCRDGALRVFESESGEPVSLVQLGTNTEWVSSVAFSPAGNWVAGQGSFGVGVFRAADGSPRWPQLAPVPMHSRQVIFSPDLRHIAIRQQWSNTEGGVLILDAETGVTVWQDSLRSAVIQFDYSPDGHRIAAGCASAEQPHGALRVYDTGLERSRRSHNGPVSRVALSTAGIRLVATASGNMATIFHADSGDLLLERSHPGVLTAIAFSPDGGEFVTGSTSGVRLFQTVSGERVWLLEHGAVNAVAISPGTGEWVATASNDRNARLVRRDNGEERWKQPHPSGVGHIAFSADAQWVATGAGRVTRILDLTDGSERHRVEQDDRVQALAFSPVGSLLATASQDGTVHVIDASTGALRGPLAHPQAVTAVAFSPDGSLLATGGADRTVRVFSLNEEPPVLLHQWAYDAPVSQLAFQPVGRGLAIATEAPLIRIVDPETGEERRHLNHSAAVHHLVFGADGGLLATGCDDKTARVYAVGPP